MNDSASAPAPWATASLVLADGSVFWGRGIGATGRTLVEPNDPDSSDLEFVLIAEPTLGNAALGQDGILAFDADAAGEEILRVKVTDERGNAEVVEIPVTVAKRKNEDKGNCSALPASGSALSLLGLLGLIGLIRRQPR